MEKIPIGELLREDLDTLAVLNADKIKNFEDLRREILANCNPKCFERYLKVLEKWSEKHE